MTQSPTGGPAQTTYQVTSRAGVVGHDAQRVVIVTDGRPAEGGPQQAAYFVSDAEIAAGDFIVTGNKPLPIVQVGAAGVEYPPIAVYDVTGKPDDAQPSQNPAVPPVGPQFSTAEIGTVNAFTLPVTFDRDISASDYSAGVTIKVNGTATSITSATRQANHAIVRYVIPVLWHGSGDTVTWEYEQVSGNIVAESDATPLGDVTAQSVTNNCEYAALSDLQADMLALNDSDPVSTWADQSSAGHDFTQTGAARPTYRAGGGVPYVEFVSQTSWMEGDDFADNLISATFLFCVSDVTTNGQLICIMSKLNDYFTGQGWMCEPDTIFIQEAGGSVYLQVAGSDPGGKHVFSNEKLSNTEIHNYRDGVLFTANTVSNGTVMTFANNLTVLIGTNHAQDSWCGGKFYALCIYTPAPSSTNRAALEARLAARYGITL